MELCQKLAADEGGQPEPPDFTLITKQRVQQAIDKIEEAVADKGDVSKAVKQKFNYAKNKWLQALDKYEAKEEFNAYNVVAGSTHPKLPASPMMSQA